MGDRAAMVPERGADFGECLSYRKDVLAFVLRMARDEELARDIVQETFARAFKGAGRFSGKSGLKTWLFAIAKNETLRAIGKRKMELRKLDALRRRENAAPEAFEGGAIDLEASLEQVKDGCLYALLSCLPFGQRCAFILHVLNGLTIGETAAILGKGENATRIAASRARSAIRSFLCGSCERLGGAAACRCRNMLGYSMKRSLIRRIEATDAVRGAKRALHAFSDEVELLKSLPDGASIEPFRADVPWTGIFTKN